ncbi:P-loop containing nucleoside triphosphate hydrolase protein [Karstenula rhodostoma CBS 690.94]|uniref:ATP-dependent DNA helicase n=1 Tax=Karstenula rhodostoma CBS 690.94 TaxID=1392251 RepID=A0A9P4PEB9_9PLEO|nr:P-loop containing nucleoside triphosphate hydrolase protein [Karstenula rhodostoma CBS 690.94]
MDSDDDFGDDFDDTAFLEATTQAEKENTPPVSPRPLKRRRTDLQNERTRPTPPRKHTRNQRPRPFVSSSEEDDVDEEDHDASAPVATRRKRASTEHDNGDDSTAPTRVALATRKKRGRPKINDDGNDRESESPRKTGVAEKRQNRIHQPSVARDLTDVYLTQPPREASPPWMPRGAIWQKPATSIGVHTPVVFDAMKTMMMPSRQSIASRPVSQASRHSESASPTRPVGLPKLPAVDGTSMQYDATEELADLPSDAFASSPSSLQNPDDLVLVSERRTRVVAPQTGLRQTTLFGRTTVNGEIPQSQANKRYNFIVDQKEEPPTHHKLDPEAIKTWVYPTNLGTIRDYQFNIVARGLFHNLLVALPTGLGKTFIAATIMLNYFRWTTEAQIVFVAPTKPLVAQQIDACYHICGIPRSATTMLIGGVAPALRAEEWASKRVFFMTPQTLVNDLKHGYADPKKIVLLVVDEAHRATGGYAYVEAVSFLRRFNNSFRVLALTATPGADIEAVQKVIDGLDISRVEIRTERSLDIVKYIHHRRVEKHVFKDSDEIQMCKELYAQALQPTVNKVAGLNAFYSKDPLDITPYGVTLARKRWAQDAGQRATPAQKGMVNSVFTILGSISQGMELLKYHGIGPFYIKMKEFKESQTQGKSKTKESICNSDAFKKLMVRLQTWTSNENFVGHPKMEFLQQAILDHFVNAGDGSGTDTAATQTRIMVFAHFRDSAEEIVRVLRRHQPMIRPRVFVGQSSGKNSEGMNQKEQLDVIEKFKAGTFNTLVATSIGEEGLDIGDLDLIILYDSKASPIRMLQRMGRTGRKREGKVIFLQMEGKEEKDANKAKDSYETMQELIAEGSRFNFHDEISRKILPRDVQPVVERRIIEIPLENSQSDWLPEPKKKRGRAPKKPPKKFNMPDGVITGFVTANRMDEEIAPKSRSTKAARVYPSEEVLELPSLESVYLDEPAFQDLHYRYISVFDEDDESISALNLRAHPYHQRILSGTHNFPRHGWATHAFVRTVQRMHTMDDDRLDDFQSKMHVEDWKEMPPNIVVSDKDTKPDMWVDDDLASQPLQRAKSKVKPGSDPKARVATEPVNPPDMWADEDPPSQPAHKAKTKATAKANPEAKAKARAEPKPKAAATALPKQAAPRGRPRKDATATITPTRPRKRQPPMSENHTWRDSGLADEGEESSPPPTDPRMRIASQAETIGSEDSEGAFDPQDTQAYRLDSDLVSFIAEDDENVDLPPTSSLPGNSLNGLGKGTQAVLKAARPKRAKKAEKIFTSDISDDDAVVSSDSDDDAPLHTSKATTSNARAFVIDSASEIEDDDDDEPIVPRKRARRVVEDDDDDE